MSTTAGTAGAYQHHGAQLWTPMLQGPPTQGDIVPRGSRMEPLEPLGRKGFKDGSTKRREKKSFPRPLIRHCLGIFMAVHLLTLFPKHETCQLVIASVVN